MGLELLQKVRKDKKKKGSKPSTQKNNPESESMQCTDILLWFNPSQQFRPCSCKTALCQLPVLTACWHHLYTALLTPAEGWRAKGQVNQVIDWFDWVFFHVGCRRELIPDTKRNLLACREKYSSSFYLILFCALHISLCIYKRTPSNPSLFLTLATTSFFSSGISYPSHIRMFSSTSCESSLPSTDYHL